MAEFSIYNTTFLKNNAIINEKQSLMNSLISLSSGDPAFVKILNSELKENEKSNNELSLLLRKKYPGSMASEFIKALTQISIPKVADTTAYIMDHFLDNIDFNSMALHRSDVLASAILNYLSFSENPNNTFTEQAEKYCY